jgi:hypothetical protein
MHVHAACPYCMPMLHVHTACPYCMSILHVHAASHFCMSLLHVQDACQCCIVSFGGNPTIVSFRENPIIRLSYFVSFRRAILAKFGEIKILSFRFGKISANKSLSSFRFGKIPFKLQYFVSLRLAILTKFRQNKYFVFSFCHFVSAIYFVSGGTLQITVLFL